MNYIDSVPLALEKKREKILTFWASVRGKTKPFLIGTELKTKDLLKTAGAAGKRTRHSNPRIAYAERRVKPLARLLRYATALRVTAPPSRSARSSPGREAAKRTLDGEDRSGIIQGDPVEGHPLAGALLERLGEGGHSLLKAFCPALSGS